MPDTVTTTTPEQLALARLQAQVIDLAWLLGRVIEATYGRSWSEHDSRVIPLLEWEKEEISLDEDGEPFVDGQWVYVPE